MSVQVTETGPENGKRARAIGLVFAALAVLSVTPAWSDPFPAELDMSDLLPANGGDGTDGTIFRGIAAEDRSGVWVSSAGDINGDGVDDIIIGALQAAPGGTANAGESYVVFGSDTGLPAVSELSDLLAVNGGDGTSGFVLRGAAINDFSGERVSGGTDINGDNIDDLAIGAAFADAAGANDSGETYIIYGSISDFPAEIEVSTLFSANGGDGSVGSVIQGALIGDFAGSVTMGGDFNNDTIDDLLIGAFRADPNGRSRAGETYVVFGRLGGFGAEFALSALKPGNGGDGSEGTILRGLDAFDMSGFAVDNAGDLNADGIDDVLIGAPEASATGLSFAGEAYAFFGRATFAAQYNLSSLLPGNGGDGSQGIVFYGEAQNAVTGYAVSGAGDVNSDGFDDLLIGARFLDAGRVYMVYGRDTGFPATFLLSSLSAANGGDGSEGVIVDGVMTGDLAGHSLDAVGDVNDDGIDDIAIGSHTAAMGAFVVFGAAGGFGAELELSSLLLANGGDGSAGVAIRGLDPADSFGRSVAAAGDVNDDGVADLIVGADTADPNGLSIAGESYLIYGRAGPIEPDGDGDGVPDATDNCPDDGNPDQLDDDSDDVGDACDNCTALANTAQFDSNADGLGNVCDADVAGPDGVGVDDCQINFLDLTALADAFFSNPASPNWNPDTDLTGPAGVPDDQVNFVDLTAMADSFFGPPGPSANVCVLL